MAKAFRTVPVRLSVVDRDRLEAEAKADRVSLTTVVQRRMREELQRLPPAPGPVLWRRQSAAVPKTTFSLKSDLVTALETVAREVNADLGETAFNLLQLSLERSPVEMAA